MKIIDNNGVVYESLREFARAKHVDRRFVQRQLKEKGEYVNRTRKLTAQPYLDTEIAQAPIDEEYEQWKALKESGFCYYPITPAREFKSIRYAVALFSDLHLEETVHPDAVLGLNEYNLEIAKERVLAYFRNLVVCLQRDKVDTLYFAALGDNMSGYIHDELAQENGLTPCEAVVEMQSLIVSGLKFIREHMPKLHIVMICIVGNHSRTTKKLQHANGFKMSYEFIAYHNIKNMCEMLGLNIEFIIPNSEMAFVEMPDGRKFIFIHGFQLRGGGTNTVCGIYPALQRLAMKWQRTFKQDKIYLGHFHSCISIPSATCNGSIIGFNAFALSGGFAYEEPAQMYECYDSEIGLLLTRKIYCN